MKPTSMQHFCAISCCPKMSNNNKVIHSSVSLCCCSHRSKLQTLCHVPLCLSCLSTCTMYGLGLHLQRVPNMGQSSLLQLFCFHTFSGIISPTRIHPAAAVRGPATTQNLFSIYSISSHLPTQYSLTRRLYGFNNIPFLLFSFPFSLILVQQLGKQLLSGKSQVLFFSPLC